MKTSIFNGQQVRLIKALQIKLSMPKGVEYKPVIDTEGSWWQVEYITGPNNGNRVPVPFEKLK